MRVAYFLAFPPRAATVTTLKVLRDDGVPAPCGKTSATLAPPLLGYRHCALLEERFLKTTRQPWGADPTWVLPMHSERLE